MKKIIAFILLIALTITALCSCGTAIAENGDVTVVVEAADGEYEVYKTYLENVENKKSGALGVLENLRDREENPLNLVMEDSTYGAFVTEIGSIKQADGAYVMVYTSVKSDSYEDAPSVEYDGMTLYQSGVGLSGMSVEAGTVILFRLESYS